MNNIFVKKPIQLLATCILYFLTALPASALEFEEIRVDFLEQGTPYWVPVYNQNDVSHFPAIDEFYILDGSRTPAVSLTPKEKARLYATAYGVWTIVTSDSWDYRKESEDFVKTAFGTVDDIRNFGTDDLLFSAASIFAGGASGCVAGAAGGAVITAVVGGVGAVPGCAAGAAVLGGVAAVDTVGGALINAISTYDDASRESIVITESSALLGAIYKMSADLEAAKARWITNKQVISVFEFEKYYHTYYEHVLYSKMLAEFLMTMLPEDAVLQEKIVNSSIGTASALANFWIPVPIPVSTLGSACNFWFGPSWDTLAESLIDELNGSLEDLATTYLDVLPTSSENIERFKAEFEDREPVIFEKFSLASEVYDINANLPLKAGLEKNGGSYDQGTVSYYILDSKGNEVQTGDLAFDGSEYSKTINVGSNPGNYIAVVSAKDSTENELGFQTQHYLINNPAEGHDLAINLLEISKFNVEPGKDSIVIDLSLTNKGEYTETPIVTLRVEGPGSYTWTSSPKTLSPLAPGYSQGFNDVISWPVPSSANDGSYSLEVLAVGPSGDFTITDNTAIRTAYVGEIPPNTSEMMAGSGWFAEYHEDFHLGSYGALDTYGMNGWVYYRASNGSNYEVGIEPWNSKYGMLVKRNGSVIYNELGFDGDNDYGEIVYVDDHLGIFVEDWSGDDVLVYFAEPIQNVGITPKERSTIPNVYVDYFADMGVEPDCNFDSRDIYDARQDSRGQWHYDMDSPSTNLAISDVTCERSQDGYSFKLTAASPGTYGFAVELEQRDTYYNPSISAHSSTGGTEVNEKRIWLVGRLVVEDYNDIAITSSSIVSGRSGDVINMSATVAKQGTLTPSDIELLWEITGPNDYQYQTAATGKIGVNPLEWDTNGLDSGEYMVQVMAVSQGDIDSDDINVNKTIELARPHLTQVVSANNLTIQPAMVSMASQGAEDDTILKPGMTHNLQIELRNESGICQVDGLVVAIQTDSAGEMVNLGSTPLEQVSGSCLFTGEIQILEGASAIKIIGHLNRYDDGQLLDTLAVAENLPPEISISLHCNPIITKLGQSLQLDANIQDLDGDGVGVFVWSITAPSGERTFSRNLQSLLVTFNEIGEYRIDLEAIDGVGMEGEPASIKFQVVDAGIQLEESISALQMLSSPAGTSSRCPIPDYSGNGQIGIEDVIFILQSL